MIPVIRCASLMHWPGYPDSDLRTCRYCGVRECATCQESNQDEEAFGTELGPACDECLETVVFLIRWTLAAAGAAWWTILAIEYGDPYCRVCGCTGDHACEGGCSWVEEDLCSACA